MDDSRTPLHDLPPGYVEREHLVATEPETLLRLAKWSLLPLAAALVGMALWAVLLARLRPGFEIGGQPFFASTALSLLLLVGVLPLHEAIHGLAILWTGHKPRFGMELNKGILYATADNALFRRREFVVIALAPLVVISAGALLGTLLLPGSAYIPVTLAAALNANGAIGDLWMARAVLRYPPDMLVRDEQDGIRIFAAESMPA